MARRINTKFLVVFSVIVLGGVGAAFILAGPGRNWIRGNPSKQLVAAADKLVEEADAAASPADKRDKLEAAGLNYQHAIGADPKNLDVYIKLGDALSKKAQFEPFVAINQSRQAWERALEVKPDYLPALRRLLDSYYKEAEIGNPQSTYFARQRDLAATVHRLDPSDVRAEALMYIAPLNKWLANIETPAKEIDDAVAGLTALIEKNPAVPEFADMVFYVAGAKAKAGAEARRGGQEKQGAELIGQGVQVFEAALKRQPENAKLHYRYFELLTFVTPQAGKREEQQRYVDAMRVHVAKARELVKPDQDPALFVKAYVAANQVALTDRDAKKAEQFLVDLNKALPDQQRARLELAKLWRYDPARQADAIALLERPVADAGWVGVEAKLKPGLEISTLSELANMYVERYAALDPAKRPEALKQIEATYDKLLAKAQERSEVLKVRGKLELLRGGPDAAVRAIQTFERAQEQYRVETGGRGEDLELTFLLGRAYAASRQSGQARAQLEKFVQRRPEHAGARTLLAQLLVNEGDLAAARKHVDVLEKQVKGDDAELIRLKLAVLTPGDAAGAKALFDRLPEGETAGLDPAARRNQRMAKAAVAPLAPISSPAEALRLYKLVLADNPADFDALQGAKDLLVRAGKKDEALALLEAGQAKADANTAGKIALVVTQLKGASGAEVKAQAEQLLRQQLAGDPFGLELKLSEFHLADGNRAKAFEHLRAAEKLKHDDPRVLEPLFQYHAAAREWDKAAWYVDRLAEKNADQAGGLIFRFRLAVLRNDIPGATEHAREMTIKLKEFARSWVFLGQAYQMAGKYDDAIQAFNLALDKQSENAEAFEGAITSYYQLNRPADALRYIDRGLRARPNDPRLKEQWRNYHLTYGDPTRVVQAVLAERDANPKDARAWWALGQAQLAAARKGDKDSAKYAADARATFAAAVKQWPGERSFWAYLVEVAEFAKDGAAAEAALKEMAARPEFKDSPDPGMMLADHYLRNQDGARGEATMRQVVERFKDNTELRRRLAAYYTQTGRYADALKLLDPASSDPAIRQQVAEVYLMDKKFAEAEQLLRGMIASDPKDAQLHALLGVALLNRQQPEPALESLNKALSIDPKNPAALFSRGAIYLSSKTPSLSRAIADFAALRDVAPDHLDARINLAEALRQTQQYAAAARELQEVLSRAPGRRDVRMILFGLYANTMKPPAWNDAEQLMLRAKELEPRDVTWPRMLAQVYAQRNLHDRAVRELEQAFAIDRQNAKEIKGYQPADDLTRDYLDVMERGKMYPQLAAQADALLKDPAQAKAGWWAYVKRGSARAHTGQKPEALADFQRALEIAQTDKGLGGDVQLAILGKLREHVDAASALAHFKALADQPSGAGDRWKLVMAVLHLQAKDKAQAIKEVEAVRAKSAALDERERMLALTVAGNLYLSPSADGAAPDYDKGRQVYEEILARRPDDLDALNNLAFILAEHTTPPDTAKALEYCERAYRIVSRPQFQDRAAVANVLDTFGWVNVLAGGANVDRGIEHLNSSLRAVEIPEAQYHLGIAHLRKNNPAEAKRSLTRAGEIIQAQADAKQPFDAELKQKVEQGLSEVEKALFAPRAGNP